MLLVCTVVVFAVGIAVVVVRFAFRRVRAWVDGMIAAVGLPEESTWNTTDAINEHGPRKATREADISACEGFRVAS